MVKNRSLDRLYLHKGCVVLDFTAVLRYIETFVEEDNNKYVLNKKNNLLQKFIIYRICENILDLVEHKRGKLVLFFEKNFSLNFLSGHEQYIMSVVKKLRSLLGISIMETDVTFDDFVACLSKKDGLAAEYGAKIKSASNKCKKMHSLENFYKFLSKNSIYKIQQQIDGDINKKLGLFLT